MAAGARQFFERMFEAMNAGDFATLEELIDPDFIGDFPQSGERTRGWSGFRAQIENYPGGLPSAGSALPEASVVGGEERWAITPNYTVVPLAGPDVYTGMTKARYPDGSVWHIITIATLRNGRIYRSETYFAPEIEPPEWRRDLVELVPRD